MKSPYLGWFCILGLIAVLSETVKGQDSGAEPDLSEAVDKYYRVLRKSPTRAHLYDRFIDAWLENRPLSELGAFFESRASAEGATVEDKMLAAFHFDRKGEIPAALEYCARALAQESALSSSIRPKPFSRASGKRKQRNASRSCRVTPTPKSSPVRSHVSRSCETSCDRYSKG